MLARKCVQFCRWLTILLLITFLAACGDKHSSPTTGKPSASVPVEDKLAQLQMRSERGDAKAQAELGNMYYRGKGVAQDIIKAKELLEKAAMQGEPEAQNSYGWLLHDGKGLQKDSAKALEFWRKSAEKGNPEGQVLLGQAYLHGFGTTKDTALALEWFHKSAGNGYHVAEFLIGFLYDSGEGVTQDRAKAIEWYKKSADKNFAEAQYKLGVAYESGHGLPKDEQKSFEWYEKAATQGHQEAQYHLGYAYYFGIGVPKDLSKAMDWYKKSASQGDSVSQVMLGLSYIDGQGLPKDRVLAYAWLNLAAASGKEKIATRRRDEILLTPSERAEAQRISSNWKTGQVLQREGASGESRSQLKPQSGSLAKAGSGTAFYITTQGHAITNHHVISGCQEVRMRGSSDILQVITSDKVNDLALLKASGTTGYAAQLTPTSRVLRQGQEIIVFGYPLGSVLSAGGNLTQGIVSAIAGLGNNTSQIQITASIQPGSSGSPVLDKNGHVIGVVNMKISDSAVAKKTGSLPQNVNFAVNGATLRLFLDANTVPYSTGGSLFVRSKDPVDIGDQARKWTVPVECWK